MRLRLKWIAATGAILSTILLADGATGAFASTTSVTQPCSSNPYAESTAQAAISCGYGVFPLVRTIMTSDGGVAHIYRTSSTTTAMELTPPASFDPITASAQELNLYGFSPRPTSTDSAALATWESAAQKRRYAPAPPFLAFRPGTSSSPCPYTGNSACTWSGYMDNAQAAGTTFLQEAAVFNEPIVSNVSGCSPNNGTTWGGIGGVFGNTNLAQDGTQIMEPSTSGQDQAWYDLATYSPSSGWFWMNMAPIPVYATEGQPFEANSQYYGTDVWINGTWFGGDTFQFYLQNLYTGSGQVWYQSTGQVNWLNGTTAEFIVERPLTGGVPGQNIRLTDGNTFGFDQAYVDGTGVGGWPWWQWNMVNLSHTGDVLEEPQGLPSGDSGFVEKYYACW